MPIHWGVLQPKMAFILAYRRQWNITTCLILLLVIYPALIKDHRMLDIDFIGYRGGFLTLIFLRQPSREAFFVEPKQHPALRNQ